MPSTPAAAVPPQPLRLSAVLYAGFFLCTIAAALVSGGDGLRQAALVLLLLYLLREGLNIPVAQRWIGLGLAAAGLTLGVIAGDGPGVLITGVEKALPFLVLFAAVSCLKMPALESPSLRIVGRQVVAQPPGRRFLAVAMGAHLFGAVLNLAGLQLVAAVLGSASEDSLRRRLTLAIVRGFSASSSWSPLFVATAVIISAIPGAAWTDVALPGIGAGLLIIAFAWVLDRCIRPSPTPQSTGPQSTSAPIAGPVPLRAMRPAVAWARMIGIFLSLCAPILLLVEVGGLSMPISVGLVAPVHALTWLVLIQGGPEGAGSRSVPRGLVDLRDQLRTQLPTLRGEVLLFTGAGLFATGVARLVLDGALGFQPPTGDGAIAMIVGSLVLFGLVGLHPVIPVLVIAQSFPPDVLGLTPQEMALSMMVSWGMSTALSPFSATSLYLSRLLGLPGWVIAWRWNAAYCLGGAVFVALGLMAFHHLG